MSDTGTARAIVLDIEDAAPTSRRPTLRVVATPTWDDVPSGPVPAEVIRYFEDALAREQERRLARASRVVPLNSASTSA